jgi:hypothetical protein
MAMRRGDKAQILIQTTAAKTATTGEAMTQVSGLLYKVTNPAKQYWDPASTTAIKDNGSAVSPIFIEYTGGYVLLPSTPVGPVTSDFSYFAAAQVGGVKGFDLDIQMVTEDAGCIGDLGSKPEPLHTKWTMKADRFFVDNRASLLTSMSGANNDMILVARKQGVLGNAISLEMLGGNNKTLGVTVPTPGEIVVQLGTNSGGTVTSTTNEVRAAIYANLAAMFYLDSILNAGGDDGTGNPTVLAHTHLSGGLDPDWLTRMLAGSKVAVVAYIDNTAGTLERFEGMGEISGLSEEMIFGKLTTEPITITGWDRIAMHSG